MIRLKSLLKERRIPPDFTASEQEILGWKNFWFTKIRNQLNQAIHNWWRDGILNDETLEEYLKVMEDLGELLKSTNRQANKLMGGGVGGAGDFEGD